LRLDYYTRTVFEFECARLGAQSGVGGGGRYDGLVEALGGPPTAGIGWGAGIERIALAIEAEPEPLTRDVFVAADDALRNQAFGVVRDLRRAGISAETDLADRSIKGQMKQADRVGARLTVLLEEGAKPKLRDMSSGEQREVDLDDIVEQVRQSRPRTRSGGGGV
jgi:histidyl-tRNA synthetase